MYVHSSFSFMYLVHLASKFSSFSSKEVSLLGFTLQQASKLSVLRNRFSSFTLFGLFVFSPSHKVHCGSESLSAFSVAVQSFWLFSSYGLINWPQVLHVYMKNHIRVFFSLLEMTHVTRFHIHCPELVTWLQSATWGLGNIFPCYREEEHEKGLGELTVLSLS